MQAIYSQPEQGDFSQEIFKYVLTYISFQAVSLTRRQSCYFCSGKHPIPYKPSKKAAWLSHRGSVLVQTARMLLTWQSAKNIMSSFNHGNGAAFPESCWAHCPPHRLNWRWRRVWEQVPLVRGEEAPKSLRN